MVKIQDIDFSDQRFKLDFARRANAYNRTQEALKKSSLTDEIILYSLPSQAKKIIVDGFKRADFYKQEGKDEIPAKVISHKDKSEKEMFVLSLTKNSFAHKFRLMDKVRIISRLCFSYQVSQEEIRTKYSEFIGIPASKKYISKLEKIGDLDLKVERFIDNNNYKMESALAFTQFTSDEQSELVDFIENFRLTESVLREILKNLYEIMRREEKSLDDLLTQVKNKLEKYESGQLRELLFRLRYPEYSSYKSKLNKLKGDLSLPPQIKLVTPTHFEGDKFTFQINFNNLEQLRSLRTKLDNVISSKSLEEILSLY